MKMKMRVAYAWFDGKIRIGKKLPEGAFPIACSNKHKLKKAIRKTAVKVKNKAVVPNLASAKEYNRRLRAFMNYRKKIHSFLENKKRG